MEPTKDPATYYVTHRERQQQGRGQAQLRPLTRMALWAKLAREHAQMDRESTEHKRDA